MSRIHKAGTARFAWRGPQLYFDGKSTGASIIEDPQWFGMWRIKFQNHISDMVNLSRAKDAAIGIFRDWHRAQTTPEAPPIRQNDSPVPECRGEQ